MELWCGNGKKFKVQIWHLTFWSQVSRGPPQVKVNIYVKYHHCMSNGRGVILQKPLFNRRTDRWTDRHTAMLKPVYSTTSLAGVYKLIFNVEKSLKNDPPGRQNFMGGVTFSRPVVQNLMLKFEPCQLLTLKNDLGSHFYRWKMTRGVIFQRGHYLMLQRPFEAMRTRFRLTGNIKPSHILIC